jgi:hypothetical protein
MTTDLNPNRVNNPLAFPQKPKQAPAASGLPEKEADEKVDQVADNLAHKGAKTEQNFDKENSKLFSK